CIGLTPIEIPVATTPARPAIGSRYMPPTLSVLVAIQEGPGANQSRTTFDCPKPDARAGIAISPKSRSWKAGLALKTEAPPLATAGSRVATGPELASGVFAPIS